MKTLVVSLAIGAGALAGNDVASACGACIEDKVAATYDHAVITAAMRDHRQVLFVAVDGLRAESARARLSAIVRNVHGVQAASVRASASPAALSFAVDRMRDPQDALAQVRAALRDPGLRLTLIRIARDGVLVEPRQALSSR